MKKFLSSPHPFAALSVMCWAPTFILSRLLGDYFSPQSLGFLRYLLASLILLVIVTARKIPFPEKKDIPWFALAALLGFSMYMIVFNMGTKRTTAATSSVVLACAPVVTDIIASVFFGEKLKKIQWGAIAIQFSGILVLTLVNDSLSLNVGAALILVCAVMTGTYNAIQRKLAVKYPGLQASATGIMFGFLELAWAAPLAFKEAAAAPVSALWVVAFLGVFSSAIGYVSWAAAFARAEKTSQVANYMFLTPFLATALGFLIAGEIPDPSTILGGILIIGGALIFNKVK